MRITSILAAAALIGAGTAAAAAPDAMASGKPVKTEKVVHKTTHKTTHKTHRAAKPADTMAPAK